MIIATATELQDEREIASIHKTEEENSDHPAKILTHAIKDIDEAINPNLTTEEKRRIKNIILEFPDLLPKKDDPPRQTHLVRHKINTGNNAPVKSRYSRRYSPTERDYIAAEVKKMQQQGIVQPSESPWSSPIVLVKKKNGETRFCVDYRELNKITKRDGYPLPRIDDALDCLAGSNFFSTLDLKSGYFQCPLSEEDREKTAFSTPDGLFEFRVLPFGLSNGPATFERLMDTVLRGHKWKHCLIYLDDLCIFGKTLEEHNQRLSEILKCLEQANLSLNIKKCSFGASEISLLGHQISREGVRPDPAKTQAIRSFPTPTNQKAVRSFLGLCSYYRKFMENFSKTAAPLNELLRDGVKFNWSTDQQAAFETLKNNLTNPPLLGHFDTNQPVTLRTDACGHGIGAILAQPDATGTERVIAYASRTLSPAESRYSTTDQEGLAIVWAVKKFRPYVHGRHLTVTIDHHALCWLMTSKNLTGRLGRWALQLQEYEMTVVYKQGRKHLDADCLSRYPDPAANTTEKDTESLTKEMDTQQVPASTPLRIYAFSLEDIAQAQEEDRTLDRAREQAKRSSTFESVARVLYKRNFSKTGDNLLLVLPKPMRKQALEAAHAAKESGHLGIAKTYGKLIQKYFWPTIHRDTESYVKSCLECQRRRAPTEKAGRLQHIETPEKPFDTVGIDLLSFNTTNTGNKVIATAICHLTKYLIAEPLPDGSAEQVANFLVKHVILKHGAPRTLIHDQGKVFLSETLDQVKKRFNIAGRKTSPYHPATNGLTERSHRTLAEMISQYVNANKSDWDELLPYMVHAYNSAPQKSTKFSPFFLVHGMECTETFDTVLPPLPTSKSNSATAYGIQLGIRRRRENWQGFWQTKKRTRTKPSTTPIGKRRNSKLTTESFFKYQSGR